MEQQSIDGYAPLDPPDAALAQAYLAEADAVHERREARIDRRAMARLHFINAAVFFVYLTVLAFSFRGDGAAGIILLLIPLLALTQLQGELRESYGYQARMHGARLGWYLGGFAVVIALFLVLTGWAIFGGVRVPVPLVFVPGVLAAVIFLVLGVRERRGARGAESVIREAVPFTRGGRIMTLGIGLGMGVLVVAQGFAGSLTVVASVAQSLGIIAIIVWMLTAQSGASVPALGGMWRAPQWSVFGVSGAALALLALLPALGVAVPLLMSIGTGVVVVLLFVLAAFLRSSRV